MVEDTRMSKGQRIMEVLRHLGIERAHIASGGTGEWAHFSSEFPEAVASAAMLLSIRIPEAPARAMGSRLLVAIGEKAPPQFRATLDHCPEARVVDLPGYVGMSWDDVARDHSSLLVSELSEFYKLSEDLVPLELPAQHGNVAGISYSLSGSGPPLVLLPLGFSPSQWEPLLEDLCRDFCVIVMRGPHLGFVEALEERFPAPGYEMVLEALYRELNLHPGQSLLEVGMGSGADTRWLTKRTAGVNPITGVDINPYLLSEAAELIRAQGLEGSITMKLGDAMSLPFPDDSFDASLSITVLEECDADRGLAEMMRVTRPGGRIAVAVRAEDVPAVVNVDLPPDLKSAAERLRRGVSPNGCGDAALYARCADAGFQDARYFIAAETQTDPGSAAASIISGNLSAADGEVWDEGFQRAVRKGTFFVTRFLHCAVGTKPAKL